MQPGLYRHAVVTSFNNNDLRVRRGAGGCRAIFLRYATRHTGGCVGLTPMAGLTRTVRWLGDKCSLAPRRGSSEPV